MKLKYVLIAIMALGLLGASLIPTTPTVLVAAAENLAANGDLELGSTSGWEIAAAAIDSSVKHSGGYSLKLTATSAYSGAAYKTIPVRKNATVTVSFYYRYASDPGSKLYHVYTYQGPNTDVGPYSNADESFAAPSGCDGITTWKQVSYTFNSGNYNAITLKFCPGGSGGTACYIDDLVVTAEGGVEDEVEPYLTSFGTRMNRPKNTASNVIKNGGFESTANAQWNVSSFVGTNVNVVEDPTAPEGSHSLRFVGETNAAWYTFSVAVEKYTQYTFSAWVKSPRLSADNRATATFGVANDKTDDFLVYEPYNGNGYGSASISTKTMQLMATSPDDAWHLRSVTFYSGSHSTVNITIYGAQSCLYLDDIALYTSANGVEYISPLRTDAITAATNGGNRYCADEDSLIEGIYMTTDKAQKSWSKNPAWRNGFLSFADSGDEHGTVLKYSASAHPEWKRNYIDWIDVNPHTDYTLTLDVKRLSGGAGCITLLDDDYDSPKEFYTISFSSVDSDWQTMSVTFTTQSYSRIGFTIVDGGGAALIDEVRLFETADAVADKPIEGDNAVCRPTGIGTSVMELSEVPELLLNNNFENSVHSWDIYQGTTVTAAAAYGDGHGAHLKGDGSWGALIEQKNIPVTDGETYTLSYWYKANSNGANATLKGSTTGTQYAYEWITNSAWTYVTQTFTVEGDTSLVLNFCGGGNGMAEDIYLDEVSLTIANPANLGVAFLFEQEGFRIYADRQSCVNLSSATVIPYEDGTAYPLLQMGAVITNDSTVGPNKQLMTREHSNGGNFADVPVVYLWNTAADGCEYAVRLIHIPQSHRNTAIYARPYYVFLKDGEEIVVYGDIVSGSYDNPHPIS